MASWAVPLEPTFATTRLKRQKTPWGAAERQKNSEMLRALALTWCIEERSIKEGGLR
jgi:hypothetical protein